jgi:hypothetical protein
VFSAGFDAHRYNYSALSLDNDGDTGIVDTSFVEKP